MNTNEKNTLLVQDMPDDELFRQAIELTRVIDEDYNEDLDDFIFSIFRELMYRGSIDIFSRCQMLSKSHAWEERDIASCVLSQFGLKRHGERDKSYDHKDVFKLEKQSTYLYLLENEKDDRVLESIIYALGHFPIEEATPFLILHKNHDDSEIRRALAWILGEYSHPLALKTLLELMEDECEDVRDYATWNVGSISNIDTVEVRDALFNRLFDGIDVVEHEALMGLCIRNDERGIARLIDLLELRSVDYLLLDIAAESKSSALLPALKGIPLSQLCDPKTYQDWEYAVKECGGSVK